MNMNDADIQSPVIGDNSLASRTDIRCTLNASSTLIASIKIATKQK